MYHRALYILLCILIFTFLFKKANSQNLVANGDFEHYTTCPSGDVRDYILSSTLPLLTGWYSPNRGTSDFYHICNSTVPQNLGGTQSAHSGDGYAGMWIPNSPYEREYLMTYLTAPLEAGRRYYFEMYVSEGENYSNYACNEIAVNFADTIITNTNKQCLTLQPHIIDTSQYISSTTGWVKYSGSYLAIGGEKVIVIGTFNAIPSLKYVRNTGSNLISAYYYIDDVSLIDSCPFYTPPDLGNDTVFCNSFSQTLDAFVSPTAQYEWNTGDNTDKIIVNQTGTYWVKVTMPGCAFSDTITIGSRAISLDLGLDTTICEQTLLTLRIISEYDSLSTKYKWSTGDTTSHIDIRATGTYWMEIDSNGCHKSDTIQVLPSTFKKVSLGIDTSVCTDTFFVLDATTKDAISYKWSTSDTVPLIKTTTTDLYWVEVSNGICKYRDSINLVINKIPDINLGKDSTLCVGDTMKLDASASNADEYTWQDGSTNPIYKTANPGVYWVVIKRFNCVNRDTVRLFQYPLLTVDLGKDTFVCEDTSYRIVPDKEFASYQWNTGSTDKTIEASVPGDFWLIVKDGHGCSATDTIKLTEISKPIITIDSLIKKCEPDFILDPGEFKSYLWQDGLTSPTYHVTNYGIYQVVVTNSYNCKNEATIEVLNDCPDEVIIPNVFTPDGDAINDNFRIDIFGETQYYLIIYNRWGNEVFESKDKRKTWDGTTEAGINCPGGAYFYIFNYQLTGKGPDTLRGTIELIR